jgi:acyl carrier protein
MPIADQDCMRLHRKGDRLDMANMENDIIEIVAKQAKVDGATLKADTRLSELDLQSIDIIELIFAIEDKFDIEVPYSPNDLNSSGISFETIGDLVAAVERLTTEQHAKKAV